MGSNSNPQARNYPPKLPSNGGHSNYPAPKKNQTNPQSRTKWMQFWTLEFLAEKKQKKLGGSDSSWWFQTFLYIFYVHPYLGRWSNLTTIFLKWVVQPPTRIFFGCRSSWAPRYFPDAAIPCWSYDFIVAAMSCWCLALCGPVFLGIPIFPGGPKTIQ